MATSARVALQPQNEATRPFGKGRATSNQIFNGSNIDTTAIIRAQFLRRCGVPSVRDGVMTMLLFGELRHDA